MSVTFAVIAILIFNVGFVVGALYGATKHRNPD
jgi:hypothetical protein